MLRRTPHNQLSVLLRKEQVRNCKNVYSNVSVQKRLEKLPIPDLYYQLTRMDRPTLKAGYKFLPPTAETHPHLVKAGELAPGITAAEFKERRDVVLKTVEDNSLLVIPNSDLYARSLDIPFEYRPESNFYYLTGFTEPGSILVMEKFAGAKQPKFSLYVKPHAIDAAKAFIGEVHSLESFPAHIAEKIQLKVKYVYTSDVYTNPAATLMLYDALPVDERKDLIPRVMKMQFTATRAYKREAERKLLRDATEITNNAFQAVLKTVQPGLTENQIASVFEFASKISGSQTLAFPPTFAVGYNGSDPLYIRNNQALKENQLLTVEAGVEYNMYSTCFGRTVPVSGRFTPLQKRVYELMLGVQKNVLAGCLSHGRTCTSQMHAEYMQGAVEILKQLRADKLVEISDEELDLAAQKCEYGPTFAKFFPMTVEQTVKVNGIDVAEDGFLGYHVAEGGNIIPLESTQCYSSGFRLCFPAESTKSDELKGSVFNLRDMVIINKNAPPEVLTGHFPTSADELEATMAKSADFPLASFIKNNQL